MRPVVQLEFNELSPVLMERFIAEGRLPHFARLRRESESYITVAAENPPALEPWIQWVTVHTGVDYADHGIFNLNEGHKLTHPCIWDTLTAAGYRVFVCGSMNIRYEPRPNGWFVPDPWTTDVPPHPASLQPYFTFVQRNVQEYTKDRVPLSLGDYARFLAFMVGHGLSASTVSAIVGQLANERGGRNRWKRAVLLDRLQFDVFAWHYRHLRPHFSTFFLNSTAHFQHLYWRNMEPEVFSVKPSAEEQGEFGSAVLFGYQQMDRLVGRFFDLVGDQATLVLCTGLSQQPCLNYEDSGGKVWYRPHDFDAFLDFVGVTPERRVSPLMAEEFHVYLSDPVKLRDADERLRGLRIGDRPALRVQTHEGGLLVGCGVFDALELEARLNKTDGSSLPFFDLFYRIEGVKSGMHHPDGLLWVRRPDIRPRVVPGKVPLSMITPAALSWFGLPAGKSADAGEPAGLAEGLASRTAQSTQ